MELLLALIFVVLTFWMLKKAFNSSARDLKAAPMRGQPPRAALPDVEPPRKAFARGKKAWKGDSLFDITYSDAADNVTQRRIKVASVEPESGWVYALCGLRGDYRTFRSDRMIEVINAETGEILDDPEAYFARHPERPGTGGPGQAAMMHLAMPGLLVLSCIARADGDLSEAEADLMVDYVEERDVLTPSAKWDAGILRIALVAVNASFGEAAMALEGVKPRSRERRLLSDFAERMVKANGTTDAKAESRRNRLFGTD